MKWGPLNFLLQESIASYGQFIHNVHVLSGYVFMVTQIHKTNSDNVVELLEILSSLFRPKNLNVTPISWFERRVILLEIIIINNRKPFKHDCYYYYYYYMESSNPNSSTPTVSGVVGIFLVGMTA